MYEPWAELDGDVYEWPGGYSVKWAWSLAEEWSVLYVASVGEDRILFWQDGKVAKPIREMVVPPQLAAKWCRQLTEIGNTAVPARKSK